MSIKIEMVGSLIPAALVGGLSKGAVDTVLGDIAEAARAQWIKLASGLKSSYRNDYIRGIQPVVAMPGVAVIALVGEIPHMLEDGSPQLDLRKILLGSNVPVAPFGQKGKRQAQPKKGQKPGYYRAIPFRHTTPGSTKQVGQPMGSAYGGHQAVANAKKLGKEVYGAAKEQLTATFGGPGGKTNWGSRLDTSGMGIPLLKSHHKSDIYSGMVRMEKTYEKGTQNFYMTFRTISTRVTTGWIRKAIPAQHLAKRVADYVQQIAPEAFQAYLEGSK